MKSRRIRSLASLTLGLGLAAVLGAGPASAHVTVASPGAVQGGYATLTFKVPTESDTASTTELKVQLPLDKPLASVSIQPVPGWSFTLTKAKLATPISSDGGDITQAVSTIDWKADSAATAIKPGEFQQFVISAGPLPKAPSMAFKAIQTYSDKSVVSWIEQPAPGSTAEPAHPAPTLILAAASASAPGTAPTSSAATSPTITATTTAAHSDSSGRATAGLVLGITGVLIAATALALALRRGRATPAR